MDGGSHDASGPHIEDNEMDMAAIPHEQQVFFSTSRRLEGVDAIDTLQLRPALFSGFRDLTRLRYDFPLVLVKSDKGAGTVRALSAIVDDVLAELAPRGIEGERLRRHALRLEREIRARSATGEVGLLSDLWEAAAAKVGAPSDQDAEEVLRYTAAALKLDGEVIDCDAAMPQRFVTHAWQVAHEARARAFRKNVDALVVRLSDILRAAYIHSEAGQRPEALRASIGSPHGDEFDFAVMSKLVGRRAQKDELPAGRRTRIEWALEVLRRQEFYPDALGASLDAFSYRFNDCVSAATAFRNRLPLLVETVKAMSVAELEARGAYLEEQHDAFFEAYGEQALTSDDLAVFPDYLVCIPPDRTDAPENANLMEVLSSGLPVKVLVETGDLLEEAAIGIGHFAFGVRSTRLAMTATGLGGVFVIQSPSSNLYPLRERVAAGLAHRGAALFSIYAGAGQPASSGLAPYLTAAAAMQSRACPTFSYNPFAGDNQAARFSFENNPDPSADWSVSEVEYADTQMQRVGEKSAFTFADFVLCDKRYASHFGRVPRSRWNPGMLAVADWLQLEPKEAAGRVPYLLAVDAEDLLHRVIVDARLMQAVRRNLVLWHRLQELGGINNSYAERLLAVEKAAWEAQKKREFEALQSAAPAAAGAVAPAAPAVVAASEAPPAAAAAVVEEAPAHSPDEAWIETARCPSCNECQLINDKMFLYNANKQAYIGDLKAGTYKQMVDAAESCQVAIIHPGKPWNDKEPGLAELIERAQPFL
jgi:hypothetical protein